MTSNLLVTTICRLSKQQLSRLSGIMSTAHSQLCHIQIKDPSNPELLFNEWMQEARSNGASTALMNLATASRSGEVDNRTVAIREVKPGPAFCFTAQAKSNKIKHIKDNSQVAATILLIYTHNRLNITKQIRVRGVAEQLSEEQASIYFNQDKLSGKIRMVINAECIKTDWNDLKARHDALLSEVDNGTTVEMPKTYVAYKIVPNEIEFYFAFDDGIADRLLFKKSNDTWQCERHMA